MDNQALIKQFRDVTGESEERAQFFLEAAGWNLQVGGLHFDLTHIEISFNNQIAQDTYYEQASSHAVPESR